MLDRTPTFCVQKTTIWPAVVVVTGTVNVTNQEPLPPGTATAVSANNTEPLLLSACTTTAATSSGTAASTSPPT